MRIPRLAVFILFAFLSAFSFSLATAAPASDEWKALNPAELALEAPAVEKDADAEGLFWEVRIDDNPEGDLIFNH